MNIGIYTLVALGLGLVVAGVANAIGANVLVSVNSSLPAGSTTAYTIVSNSLSGVSNLAAQFGTIGTVAAAIVVIGLLLMMVPAFGGRDGAGL